MRRRTFLRAAGGTAAATALTTAMPGSALAATRTTSGGTTHTVEMNDNLKFVPDRIEVAPGDTVVWENVGSAGHSVTAYGDKIPEGADYWSSGSFDSEQAARDGYEFGGSIDTGNVAGGKSYSHTFRTEGTHQYFCIPHESSGMVGEVVVTADPSTPTATATPGPGTDTPTTTPTDSGTDAPPGGGDTVEVAVGPGGDFVFRPGTNDPLTIPPGTTVNFVWKSNTHNIVVESKPEGSAWQGHESIENEGFEYSHTFATTGEYSYYCRPHRSAGMVADIVVEEGAALPGGDGGGDDATSLPIGVPGLIAGAFGVGIASFLSGVYYGGKRKGGGQNTAALAGVGLVGLGLVLIVAVVARLMLTG